MDSRQPSRSIEMFRPISTIANSVLISQSHDMHVTLAPCNNSMGSLGLKGISQVRQHPDHCRCTTYKPLCARKRKAALQAFKALHMHICSKHLTE